MNVLYRLNRLRFFLPVVPTGGGGDKLPLVFFAILFRFMMFVFCFFLYYLCVVYLWFIFRSLASLFIPITVKFSQLRSFLAVEISFLRL
jgi:hypothetical protein